MFGDIYIYRYSQKYQKCLTWWWKDIEDNSAGPGVIFFNVCRESWGINFQAVSNCLKKNVKLQVFYLVNSPSDFQKILLRVQKSGVHQLRLVDYPIIYRGLYIPGGAGFLPSTVLHFLPLCNCVCDVVLLNLRLWSTMPCQSPCQLVVFIAQCIPYLAIFTPECFASGVYKTSSRFSENMLKLAL